MNSISVRWSHWTMLDAEDESLDSLGEQIAAVPCFSCYMVGGLVHGELPQLCVLRGTLDCDPRRIFFLFAAIKGDKAETTLIDVRERKRYCHLHTESPVKMITEEGMSIMTVQLATASPETVPAQELDMYRRLFANSRAGKFHVVGEKPATPLLHHFEQKYATNN